jgi:hypothetical protein
MAAGKFEIVAAFAHLATPLLYMQHGLRASPLTLSTPRSRMSACGPVTATD